MRTFFVICLNILIWPIFLAGSLNATPFRYTLENEQHYNVQQKKAIQTFFKDTAARLPPRFQGAIAMHGPLVISFRTLPNSKPLRAQWLCLDGNGPREGSELGSFQWPIFAKRPKIVLNAEFITSISEGAQTSTVLPCGHGSLYKTAQATLIHETTHLYDQHHAHLSDSAQYRALSKWEKRWFRDRNKHQLPFAMPQKSIDPYELTAAAEHIAKNVEYFLLDAEYQCRRPGMFAFLSQHFGMHPFPTTTCQASTLIFMSSNRRAIQLDARRVYAVHYLWADQGEAVMSMFGHAMFRLIVCAPERTHIGPECLKDSAHHIVIGYQASINDHHIDYLSGLFGDYPLQLMTYHLHETIDQYTAVELRNLYSVPLALDRNALAIFLGAMREDLWSYQSGYRFIDRNCATEALALLQAALPDHSAVQRLSPLSPSGLFYDLKRLQLADFSHFKDKQRAAREGYYFASATRYLEPAFTRLQSWFPEFDNLQDFASNSDANIRLRAFRAAATRQTAQQFKPMATAFYILEEYIATFASDALYSRLITLVTDQQQTQMQMQTDDVGGEDLAMKEEAVRLLDLEQTKTFYDQLNPWHLTLPTAGYGVPLEGGIQTAPAIYQKIIAFQTTFDTLMTKAEGWFPDTVARKNAIQSNLSFFLAAI